MRSRTSRVMSTQNDVPAGPRTGRDRCPMRVPVAVACRVLGSRPQRSTNGSSTRVCARDLDEIYLLNASINLHTNDPSLATD